MDTDRNLLFGVIALQTDLIDSKQFGEACVAWAARKSIDLAAILVERGWITAAERAVVDQMVARKLDRFGGDVRATLSATVDDATRDVIGAMDDSEIRRSLSSLPPAAGHVLVETLAKPAGDRSRYTLSRLHASGGLGRVWVARDRDLNREVALKELRPEQAAHPDAWRRFLKEAQVTGQLEHPNIVPVYELGRGPQDDQPFYTMKFVRGQTLREAIAAYHQRRRAGSPDPLEFRQLLSAFVSVCHAIGYAHARGVVHRDLKPDNVVLGGFGEVLVLDWGLAKLVDQRDGDTAGVAVSDHAQLDATRPGAAIGTPAYMAPEQAAGQTELIDARTDIYGIGTILFEILTGQPPHRGAKIQELLTNISENPTPRARSVLARVPPALDAVCAKAMAKPRDDRFASASQIGEDVERYLADEPVSVYREPIGQRVARWMRRNRTWTQAAALALVAITATASIAAVAVNQARHREAAAKADARERLRQVREAADTLLTSVSERLQGIQGAQEVRRELLREAARQYELLAAHRTEDPELLVESALAYLRLGKIYQALEQLEPAEQSLVSAERIFESLVQQSPHVSQHAEHLTTVRTSLGQVWDGMGRPEDAEAKLRAAIAATSQQPPQGSVTRQHANAQHSLANLLEKLGRLEEAKELLEQAIARLEARSDPDRATRVALGDSLDSLALLLARLGQNEDAEQSFRRAVDQYLLVLEDDPQYYEALSFLSDAYHNLANLQRDQGRTDEAIATHRSALERREQLAAANPHVPRYLDRLANSRHSLGNLLGDLGRFQAAEEQKRKAVEEFELLVRRAPGVPEYENRLALAYANLAGPLFQTGRDDEARALFEKSLGQFARLVESHPEVPAYRERLAMTHINFGRLLRRAGELPAAIDGYRRAIAEYERLVTDHPAADRYKDGLGLACNNLALIYVMQQRFTDAESAGRRAFETFQALVKERPDVTDYLEALLMSADTYSQALLFGGRAADAEATLKSVVDTGEALVRTHHQVPLFRVRLAGVHGTLAQALGATGKLDDAHRSADRAIEIARELVQSNPQAIEYQQRLRDAERIKQAIEQQREAK